MAKKRREVAKFVKYCEYCGKEFMAKRSHARFCCDSHRAMAGDGRVMELVDSRRAELRNKIEDLIQEIGKPGENKDVDEARGVLRDWTYKMMDKMLFAVRNGDIKELEEINAKLGELVDD